MEIYNNQRLHVALEYIAHNEAYFKGANDKVFNDKEIFLETSQMSWNKKYFGSGLDKGAQFVLLQLKFSG